jgi:hypothetical protein
MIWADRRAFEAGGVFPGDIQHLQPVLLGEGLDLPILNHPGRPLDGQVVQPAVRLHLLFG